MKDSLKKPIKCFVKESFPHFLVSDGYFFVPCYFTDAAIKSFKSKHSNINIVDLAEKVIVLSKWSLEMKKVNSAEVFTSYANIEARLVVHEFSAKLQEKLAPVRFPINLFRDDEMKTIVQHYRHQCVQDALNKQAASSLPGIEKLDGKKGKVDSNGIVSLKSGKKGEDDEFTDFTFKEGNTKTVSMKEIFAQEKGKDALKSHGHSSAPKVKGGKTKSKSAKKSVKKGGDSVRKNAEKILSHSPAASKKKATSKKHTPAMPTPGGKKSKRTTDQMTMEQFKKYLKWHESGKTKKVLGKRSQGK